MGLYTVNFHTCAMRSGRPANSIRFAAANDGAAEAVATELGNWTTGQRTSLSSKIFFDNTLGYPNGTRLTASAIVTDASSNVFKVRARNLKPAASEADLSALLTGVIGTSAIGVLLIPLSAAPSIPGGAVISAVQSVTISNKF